MLPVLHFYRLSYDWEECSGGAYTYWTKKALPTILVNLTNQFLKQKVTLHGSHNSSKFLSVLLIPILFFRFSVPNRPTDTVRHSWTTAFDVFISSEVEFHQKKPSSSSLPAFSPSSWPCSRCSAEEFLPRQLFKCEQFFIHSHNNRKGFFLMLPGNKRHSEELKL